MNKPVVLIVEDESVVALNIAHIIRSLGYEAVGPVATGEAALTMLRQDHIDLVLMDVRLKGNMDGIEVAREVGLEFHIPVVYLTAYTDSETLERAKLTTPYGYITKAFDDRELHSTIEMTERYAHLAPENLKAAVGVLDRLRSGYAAGSEGVRAIGNSL